MPITRPPAAGTQPNHLEHLEHLASWLHAEQGECLRKIAQCRAAGNEDVVYWARRHAQLCIAETVTRWFTASATI